MLTFKGKIGKFLDLPGLSTVAEYEEGSCKCEPQKEENDKGDEEMGHYWGDGRGSSSVARIISNDESGKYGHCG